MYSFNIDKNALTSVRCT